MLKHDLAWFDDEEVISACSAALSSAGVTTALETGLRLNGEVPTRLSAEPRPTIDWSHRTLWNESEYSIYAEWEYAVLGWPGGLYPIGRHYGDCTSGLANVRRGWCVTGGAGLTVTLFEDGLPQGRGAIDPSRVLSYTVGSTNVPEGMSATTDEVREFLIGARGPQEILWVEAAWQDRGGSESDLVWAASSDGNLYQLDVLTQQLRIVATHDTTGSA